jgi:ABC-type phosphate/phosphonate transport system substrate-binding protein
MDSYPIYFIYRSKELPGYVLAVNESIGIDNIHKIETALLKLNEHYNSEVLLSLDKGYTGFVKTKDSNYNIIRKMINTIE